MHNIKLWGKFTISQVNSNFIWSILQQNSGWCNEIYLSFWVFDSDDSAIDVYWKINKWPMKKSIYFVISRWFVHQLLLTKGVEVTGIEIIGGFWYNCHGKAESRLWNGVETEGTAFCLLEREEGCVLRFGGNDMFGAWLNG